jgi:hypothetical protein
MPPFDLSKTPAQIVSLLQRNDEDRTYVPVFYVNDFWTYKVRKLIQYSLIFEMIEVFVLF